MNVFLNTYAYLRSAEQLTSSAVIVGFLEKVAAFGYRIQQSLSDEYWAWSDLTSSKRTRPIEIPPQYVELFSAGLDPSVRDKFMKFLEQKQNINTASANFEDEVYRIEACAVDLTPNFWGMNVTITLDFSKNMLILTVDERLLDAVDSPVRRDQWFDFAVLVYEHFHPLFELPLNEDYGPFEQRADVEAGRIQWLRRFNFYSQELVSHFGRERLLATPDASIEEFEDGGILLIPRNPKTVAAYLKLRLPYTLFG